MFCRQPCIRSQEAVQEMEGLPQSRIGRGDLSDTNDISHRQILWRVLSNVSSVPHSQL